MWGRLLCRLRIHDPRLLEWRWPVMVSRCKRCLKLLEDKS